MVAIALSVAAGLLLLVLRRSLERSADALAADRAWQVAAQLTTEGPDQLDRVLLGPTGQISTLQVVDRSGVLVAASPGAPANPLVTGVSSSTRVVRSRHEGEAVALRVVSRDAGPYVVLVATEQDQVVGAVGTVAALLALGLPVLALLVGAATYLLVGRSLLPVERMRRRADAITAADLSERLPVPVPDDEIGRLARTLNAMLRRLETGQQMQRRFVADASHELRSPLATITAALEMGLARPELLAGDLVGTALLPEAQRMRRLIDDLLLLARADERGLPLHLTDVDLDDVLGAEAARLRRDGRVRVVQDVAPTRVRGDAGQLGRVVRNLVDNAERHASGTVVLSCRSGDGLAEVCVADDGPGVPEPDRARVFQRFVRRDADRDRATGGSGLGLAIVAEIVAAHDGRVQLGDSAAGGALLTVLLPVDGPAQRSAAIR